MEIKRGDIFIVSFNPSRGSEQAGVRPALVIQNDIGNKYSSTTILVAISSNIKDNPTNININPDNYNNLEKIFTVKTSQLLTISKDRLIKKIGSLSKSDLGKINNSLRISLDLNY